ncbi:MAG TPA: hypothetical protein VHR45_25530 [Thermoanaerobaculia bacterium]|nr:hypothetical protein [Thermoanaerobaculia bacterium]
MRSARVGGQARGELIAAASGAKFYQGTPANIRTVFRDISNFFSERRPEQMSEPQPSRLTFLGKLTVALFVAGCVYGAYFLLVKKAIAGAPRPGAGQAAADRQPAATGASREGQGDETAEAEIGVAYGTEKERWLTWATSEFGRTSAGKRIKVNLIPIRSLEGAASSAGRRASSGRSPGCPIRLAT